MKKLALLFIFSIMFFSCNNMMEETIDNKDHEEAKFNSSKFDKSKFGE